MLNFVRIFNSKRWIIFSRKGLTRQNSPSIALSFLLQKAKKIFFFLPVSTSTLLDQFRFISPFVLSTLSLSHFLHFTLYYYVCLDRQLSSLVSPKSRLLDDDDVDVVIPERRRDSFVSRILAAAAAVDAAALPLLWEVILVRGVGVRAGGGGRKVFVRSSMRRECWMSLNRKRSYLGRVLGDKQHTLPHLQVTRPLDFKGKWTFLSFLSRWGGSWNEATDRRLLQYSRYRWWPIRPSLARVRSIGLSGWEGRRTGAWAAWAQWMTLFEAVTSFKTWAYCVVSAERSKQHQ